MKHVPLILLEFVLGLLAWWLIEFTEIPDKELIGGFVAALVIVTVALIGNLFLEREETIRKIATIEKLQTDAGPKFEMAKEEAKGVQSHILSLEQHVFSLEQSITRGLLATSLDAPANVWQNVLDDACNAVHSIYVAITVPDFSAPREWDERLSAYIKGLKDKENIEVPYIVAIYYPKNKLNNDIIKSLLDINLIYKNKGLKSAVHGFINQSNFFRFSIITIDRKNLGFLWNSQGGDMSTKGVYFREAPALAGEISDWFVHSCRPLIEDVRDISLSTTTRQS